MERTLPKILPDIQIKILTVAENHFNEYGFVGADMRKIASDAGIAVGTIYLHFNNKETLYLNVIEFRWKSTIEKIEILTKQDIDPKEVLIQILLELTHEITRHKSANNLFTEIGFIHHHKDIKMLKDRHFSGPIKSISKLISEVLSKLAQKDQIVITKQTLYQLGSFAFIMTIDICMQESVNIENRIDLIADLISSYLCKPDHQNLID